LRLANEKTPTSSERLRVFSRGKHRLTRKLIELRSELVTLEGGRAEQVALRIAELEKQLTVRNGMLFGGKSEKRDSDEPVRLTAG
jgi:hypothetical protein